MWLFSYITLIKSAISFHKKQKKKKIYFIYLNFGPTCLHVVDFQNDSAIRYLEESRLLKLCIELFYVVLWGIYTKAELF